MVTAPAVHQLLNQTIASPKTQLLRVDYGTDLRRRTSQRFFGII